MWDRVIQYLAGLSQRERWLMLLLVFAVLPVGLFYGVVLPLSDARDAARREVADAQAVEAWVGDQAAVFMAMKGATGQKATTQGAPVGISGIEESLVSAGLRKDVAQLANNAAGGITLRFETVRFTAISEWLTASAGVWGYDLTSFTFERGKEPDVVAAELNLVPAQ
ncbi:General secretion pathway, M protein [Roseovarius litorisediminis]|uniref:General secretion pathway, M protein n=2 Tax=Roseovarius litorisediminis TaxID=1312363 RepID=A0A1Y5SSR7_9RHOB|nr:General secretion pathway, M protein [Roseovarius litorisediminis]